MASFGRVFWIAALAAAIGCTWSPYGVRPEIDHVSDDGKGRGEITITFEIWDDDLTWPSVAVEYRASDGILRKATLTDASVEGVETRFKDNVMFVERWVAYWTPCTVTWDSLADDVALGGEGDVTIRLTPSDFDGVGVAVEHTFKVNNLYPTLHVDKTGLAFEYVHGSGVNPAAQVVKVENTGPDQTTLVWSVDAATLETWLSADPAGGTLAWDAQPASVSFSVDAAGLAVGSYEAFVEFRGENPQGAPAHHSPHTLHVTLTVRAPEPAISIVDSGGGALTDLYFTAAPGGGNPGSQSFFVKNSGEAGSVLSWTATDGPGSNAWLSYAPTSGSTDAGSSTEVVVSVDASGLATGTYTAEITVTAPAAAGSPKTLTVYLTVGEAPVLSVVPASLTFTASEGGSNPAAQTLSISNPGGGTLDWSVSDDAAWLALSPTSGQCTSETDTVMVSVNISGFIANTYGATITVTAPGAAGSPQDVAVTLTVTGTAPGPARVATMTPAPGSTLGTAPASISVTFNKAIDASTVNELTFELVRSGGDGAFGDGNDVRMAPPSVALTSPTEATMDLGGTSLPDDTYQVTLYAPATERWGSVMNVAELNTASNDCIGSITPDGLVAFLHSDRPGGGGGCDIWRTTRSSLSSAWNLPTPVSELNTSADDFDPCMSADGLTMWFSSNRTGGRGLQDIWVAIRPDAYSLWGTPTNAQGLNSGYNENRPCISPDALTMWLASDVYPPTGGGWDVFLATRSDTTSSWGGKTSVAVLKVSREEYAPWVSPDGLAMYYTSDRSGGVGGHDIWRVTRPDTSSQWGAAVNVQGVNSTGNDARVWLSSDESTIWFTSNRAAGLGNADIWTARCIEPIRDLAGYRLDGEFGGTFPSGDGAEGGDFVATFTLEAGGPASGLVAHWKFDETSGQTAYDSSGNGNDGTLVNGPVWQPAGGKIGGGLDFDGDNDYVQFTSVSQTVVTMSAWVDAGGSSSSLYPRILVTPAFGLVMDRANNDLVLDGAHTGVCGRWTAPAALAGTGWHHVAITYDGSATTNAPVFYLDGSSVPVTETDAPSGSLLENAGTGFIGDWATHGRTFDGLIDDVRIYDRALSAAEVAELAATADSGLVVHWKFDETSGQTAHDSSGSGNDGTLVGDPFWLPTGGRTNGALDFDGVDDYVTIPDGIVSGKKVVSVAAWIRTSTSGVVLGMQDETYPTDPYYQRPALYVGTDGLLRGHLWSMSTDPIVSTRTVDDGLWHHVALTGDTNVQHLYLDGSLVGTLSIDILDVEAYRNQIGLGRNSGAAPALPTGWSFFDGAIDDVRIYDRALSAAEIAALASVGTDLVTIDSLAATPNAVSPGGSSTLTWTTSNATSCSIDNGVGTVASNGSSTVWPAATTTYTLTADGPGGPVTAEATVTVSAGVGGTISSDTTWTFSGSPYLVTSNVLVSPTVQLTIEPRVEVQFTAGTSLRVDGTLVARGTEAEPITFTSNAASPSPGDWAGITFTDGSADATYDAAGNCVGGCAIENAVIEYGGGSGTEGMIQAYLCSQLIRGCTIRNSLSRGVYVEGDYGGRAPVRIENSEICDNASQGVYIFACADYQVTGNTVYGNQVGGVLAMSVNNDGGLVQGNLVRHNSGYGIRTEVTSGNLLVSDNVVYANTSDGIWHHAGDWTGVLAVTRNLVIANGGHGILEGGLGLTTYNVIAENAGRGYSSLSYSYHASYNHIVHNYGDYAVWIENYYPGMEFMSNTVTQHRYDTTGTAFAIGLKNVNNGDPTLNGNNIFGNNATYAMTNDYPAVQTIDATGNWWGTASAPEIAQLVYDWSDDASLASINTTGFLTSHNLAAPISPPLNVVKSGAGGDVQLSWSASSESDCAGYRIYYGAPTGYSYANSTDVGNVTSYTLPGVSVSDEIAVTAYDSAADGVDDMVEGHESWFTRAQ